MTDRVMVFAPAPILTVIIEQQTSGAELHVHPGGQGVWQARMIAALGGWYVHDRREGNRAEIAEHPGTPLDRHDRHDRDELYTLALTEGLRSPVAVLSGPQRPEVVDADVYRRLAADLTANGVRVVADLSGDHISVVIEGGIAFVKVSHEQLIDDGRAADDSVPELVKAGREIRDAGVGAVLISRAGDPALALLDDDRVVEVHPPALQVAEHRGAGDSMTAGVAVVLARGGDVEEAVRMGAAAGALNITRHGLGTGRAEAVQELYGRVRLA